jgi:hypothetical protein
MSFIYKNATFSSCRTYRYSLSRIWDKKKKYVLFIGLNPSTADEEADDPTIRRCINYAKNWGYGGFIMVNLFAYRSTLPSKLKKVKYPVGKGNDKYIVTLSKKADITVAVWGNNGNLYSRDKQVLSLIPSLMCLKINKSGQPAHPLYLNKGLKLTKFARL